MKKILLLLLVLVLSFSLLVACGPEEQPDPECTQHVDADGNGKCDNCDADMPEEPGCTEHTDANKDGLCDECATAVVSQDLLDAAAYIRQLYKDDPEATLDDYEVTGTYGSFTVTWSVDVDAQYVKVVPGDDGMVTIDVTDVELLEDVPYVLTVTVSDANGNSVVKTFNRKVPKFEVTSFEDYMAAEENDNVIVQGIVVAMNSKSKGNTRNHLFLMDLEGKGGYYSYQMDQDPITDLGIEVGMIVRVSGPVTPYNGMQEIKGGTAKIVDSTIKTFDYIDISEKWVEGTNFNTFVALPVVIKGVTIGGQDMGEKQQYLYFELNGVKGYVRSYTTDFPTNLTATDKATMDADHFAHYSYTADVAGILITYSGAPYLIPTSVTPFTNYQLPERTDEEKLELELGAITLPGKLTSDTVLDLVLGGGTYTDVVITWESSDATLAAIADGKVTITIPDEEKKVTITATATLGEVTKTKEFEITLSKTITTLADAETIAKEAGSQYTTGKYLIAGIITEIAQDYYGNVYIQDETGKTFFVYGILGADGNTKYGDLESKPVVGDYVVLLGTLGTHKDAAQMKNGALVEFKSLTSIPDANDIGKNNPSYDTGKYLVTGTVTEIANDKYGNVYIEDDEGNKLYVYGIYSSNGTVRYDALANAPKVGDTITVYGVLGAYKDDPQMKDAWLIAHTVNAGGGDTPDVPATPSVVDTPAAETAYKFGMLQGNLNKVYYIKGGMAATYYLDTTENYDEALDVYLEATDGGYYLYCYVDGAKTYINMVVSGTHVNGKYEATASTVYTFDAEAKILVSTVNDAVYAFGTRNDKEYTTMGPVAVSYGGFHAQFYTVETTGGEGGDDPVVPPVDPEVPATPSIVDTPAAETAYKFGMLQGNLNKVYYIKGGMAATYYLDTTENYDEALDMYLEATDGGYYLYCYVDGAKTYINMVVSGTHVNGKYEATASTVYTFDAEAKILVSTVNDAVYAFGTRNDKEYTTMGPVAVSYGGFHAQFYTVETTGGEGGDTPAAPSIAGTYLAVGIKTITVEVTETTIAFIDGDRISGPFNYAIVDGAVVIYNAAGEPWNAMFYAASLDENGALASVSLESWKYDIQTPGGNEDASIIGTYTATDTYGNQFYTIVVGETTVVLTYSHPLRGDTIIEANYSIVDGAIVLTDADGATLNPLAGYLTLENGVLVGGGMNGNDFTIDAASGGAGDSDEILYGATLLAPTETVGNVTVTVTDSYCYIDLYAFKAPSAATYTFTVPSGVGVTSKDAYDSWNPPYVDYQLDDGGIFSVYLEAGEVLYFYVGALVAGDYVLEYTNEEVVIVEPVYISTWGENTITFTEADLENGITAQMWVFESGDYTFVSDNIAARVFDAYGNMMGMGSVYLTADDNAPYTVLLFCTTGVAGEYTLNVNLKGLEGSESNPYDLTVPGTVELSLDADGSVYYSFTATETGHATVTVPAAFGFTYSAGNIFGYTGDGETSLSFPVVAGTTYLLNFYNGETAAAGTASVAFEAGALTTEDYKVLISGTYAVGDYTVGVSATTINVYDADTWTFDNYYTYELIVNDDGTFTLVPALDPTMADFSYGTDVLAGGATFTVTKSDDGYALTLNPGTPAGGDNEETSKGYYLSAVADGVTYYFAGAVDSGKGTLTTDVAAAAKIYKEEAEGGFYLYILVDGAKQYLTIGASSKSFGLSADPFLLGTYTAEDGSYSVIYDVTNGDSGRGFSLYKGQDIRTYAVTAPANFNGTNGYPMALVEA